MYKIQHIIEPNRTRGQGKRRRNRTKRKRKTRQPAASTTCKNKIDDNPRPLLGIQPYLHQEHLKADKQRQNKHTNKQKQAQVTDRIIHQLDNEHATGLMNLCMFVCMYICMYVCVYVCMCVREHAIPVFHFCNVLGLWNSLYLLILICVYCSKIRWIKGKENVCQGSVGMSERFFLIQLAGHHI